MTGAPPPATGTTICDAYHRNPDAAGPHLLRCRRRAHRSLTIEAGQEVYTFYRCRGCRDELAAEAANGATFEVLNETLLPKGNSTNGPNIATETDRVACPDCGRIIDADAFCPECDFDYSERT